MRIVWSAQAHRAMGRLPMKIALAVLAFVEGPLADNPLRTTKPLQRELVGLRSAYVNTFRILVRVDQAEQVVTVLTVEHRADVYRGR